MGRFRFRISTLLILIIFLSVSFAALRQADTPWDSVILTATLTLLMMSVLLAIHGPGEKRAFWVAFAVFGGGYLGLASLPTIEPRLLTSLALSYLDSKIPGRAHVAKHSSWAKSGLTTSGTVVIVQSQPRPVARSNGMSTANPVQDQYMWTTATGFAFWPGDSGTDVFVQIGHSLLSLLFGWLGGILSRRLYLANHRPQLDNIADSSPGQAFDHAQVVERRHDPVEPEAS